MGNRYENRIIEKIETNSNRLILREARVLDVVKGVLNHAANVLVEDGIIKDLDAGNNVSGCDVIECEGGTLSPGLIDCHCHILSPFLAEQKNFLGTWVLKQMKRNLEATLAGGVVCVRDMLSPIKVLNGVRRKIETGERIGPDILASGAVLSCEGGYPEFIKPLYFPLSVILGQPKMYLESPKKAEQIVRYLAKNGADVIKVGYTSLDREMNQQSRMPVISDEVLDKICETAHAIGLKVSVHHNWSIDIPPLLRADIDSLEHIIVDSVMTDEEVNKMKEKNVSIVATLTVCEAMARFEEKLEFLESERAKELLVDNARNHLLYITRTWLDFNDEFYHPAFGYWRANKEMYERVLKSTRKMIDKGVNVLAGTDMGAVVAFPGELVEEIRRFKDVGMTEIDAIRSATIKAAEFLGISDKTGTVEPGKKAHLALFNGNPLEDISVLRKVRLVGKGKRWYRPKHSEIPDFWLGHAPFIPYEG